MLRVYYGGGWVSVLPTPASRLSIFPFPYLDERDQERALGILNNLDGVDQALGREAAAQRFQLMGSRIGDIMVLGAADVAFGNPAEVTIPGSLRSHG